MSFDWGKIVSAFWLVLAAQSIFVAIVMYLVGFSPQDTFFPVIRRFQQDKVRVLLILLYFGILLWSFTWWKALVLTVDAIAVMEFRATLKKGTLGNKITVVFAPALYLFAGLFLIFAYNDIILSVRFFGASDAMFNAADQWLLHGMSVQRLCHLALREFPIPFFRFLEFIYVGMFPQLGATLILSSLYYGKKRGLEFVGSILTAYYIALVMFYFWPSQGPYSLCLTHFSEFPRTLQTYATQNRLLTNSQALWNHVYIQRISTDYYIAFPCMHIAQPLIAMWFLRRWKRVVDVMAVYNIFLVVAIILLEWHYVVDILAGVIVAILAVTIVDTQSISRRSLPDIKPTIVAGNSGSSPQ